MNASAPAAAGTEADVYTVVALPLLAHVIRYKWLYAVAIAWVMVLVLVHPDKPAGLMQPVASSRAATTRKAAKPSTKPATTKAPSTPKVSSTPSAGGSSFTTTGDTGTAFDSSSTDTASTYDSTPSDYTPPPSSSSSSSGSDSGNSSSTPPAPPSCTTDSTLPVPVATTVVGAIGTGQSTVTGATGQAPPADAAGTVGSAAGCSGTSTGSSAQSTSSAWSGAMYSPEVFALLLSHALGA